MPRHLFINDLEYLEQNPPVGKCHLLVVGTFNPDIKSNAAQWFYGRPENEFWCLLPRTMGEPTLHTVDRNEPLNKVVDLWKNFCNEKQIIIIDIFKEVLIELPDYSDKHFNHLQEFQYIPFNFEQAFKNMSFDGILFTWKGTKPGILTALKNKYISFFANTPAMHMITPANTYPKSRFFKLNQWRSEYSILSTYGLPS